MATAKTRIIGSYLSPYVRKVLVCLDLKGISYEIDPIVPFTAMMNSRGSARCDASQSLLTIPPPWPTRR